MKKMFMFIYVILNCFLFTNVIMADEHITLDKPIIEFKKIKNYTLQGYSVVNDKLFVVLEGYDDTKSIVKVYDLNTYKELVNYKYGSLGHANDVTYNKNTNKIYILAGSGSNIVYTFNADTFEYENQFKVNLPIRSITYLEDYDMYAVRTVTTGFLYNNKFELNNKLPFVVGMNFSTEVGRQGWSYYKGLIYYANWSWVRLGGDGSNVIYVYNIKGNKLNSIYTDKDIGELENVGFYNDKMILGFNGYDNKIKFYITDVPKTNIEETTEEVKQESKIVKKKNYEAYIILGSITLLIVIILIIFILKHKKKVS